MKYLLILLPLLSFSETIYLKLETVTAVPETKYPVYKKDMAHQLKNKEVDLVLRIHTKDASGKETPFKYGVVTLISDNNVTKWEYQDRTNAFGLVEFIVTDTNEFRVCIKDKCYNKKMSVNAFGTGFIEDNGKFKTLTKAKNSPIVIDK